MEKNFETILERYAMPQGINWESVRRKIEAELSLILIETPSWKKIIRKGAKGLKFDAMEMDSEALIRTIKLFEAGGAIEIKGEGGSVQIEDETLKHFVLLSLHKLLQMKWALYNPIEEELQEGKFKRLANGSPDWVKIGIKEELWGGFIEPYNSEELEGLLMLSEGIKNYKKIRQGRGKNVAYYGDCAAAVLGAIPEEVKAAKNKTDLLNFVGEVMELAGILDNEPHWKKATETLERHEKLGHYDLGADKKARKQIVANWLKGAGRIYCQSELLGCRGKDCKNFGKCIVTEKLNSYEI